MEQIVLKGNVKLTEEQYEELTVNGYAETEMPLQADKLVVNGFLKCAGDFSCREFLCNGTTRLMGNVCMENLYCKGAVFSSGETEVRIQKIVCPGAAKFSSDVVADMLDVKGTFSIKDEGCIKVKTLNAEGSVAVNNIIEAELINSFGFIYADTIIAKNVYIRFKKTPVFKALKSEGIDTTIPTVIGDEIELVNVRAYEVKGKCVKIGANCRIDKVEYSRSIEIDPSAKVNEVIKL